MAPKEAPEEETMEQLQAKLDAAVLQRDNQAKERNKMQHDRDQLSSIMKIKTMECEQAEVDLRNTCRKTEETQETQHEALKVFNQRMKHVLFEQEGTLKELKLESEKLLREQRQVAVNRQKDLFEEARFTKEEIKEVVHNYEDLIKQMKLDHSKEIMKMKREFDATGKEMVKKIEKQVKDVRQETELKRRQEIREIEERKNSHIAQLKSKHAESYKEINQYYNDVTHNSLDLIKTLKEDIGQMRKKDRVNEKVMHDISEENRKLTEPLMKALKQVEGLRKQLAIHEKDRRSLEFLRARNADTTRHTRHIEWQFTMLKDEVEKIQAEKDVIQGKFEFCIRETQEKCEVQSNLLKRQAEYLDNELELKEGQLGLALANKALEPAAADVIRYGIDRLIETKNQQIKALSFEKGRMCQSYCHLLQAFKTKLTEIGVSLEEMGLPHYVVPGVA